VRSPDGGYGLVGLGHLRVRFVHEPLRGCVHGVAYSLAQKRFDRQMPLSKLVLSVSPGSGRRASVSVYSVSSDGTLTLNDAAEGYRVPNGAVDVGGNPSSGTVDAVVSADGKFFYQQYSGLGVVGAYQTGSSGQLAAIPAGAGGGLPAVGSEGLAGD